MTIFLVRIFLFTLLPLLAAAVLGRYDRLAQSRYRKIELYLIYLFGLGVAGSGIGGFFGHLFLSDIVAESVGWPAGSPFQQEMGFANLALGVLGVMALSRRDGFREATVIAVTVIGVGAAVVHLIDILEAGNLAPGNTLQNVANLAKPALLILFLRASRTAEGSPEALHEGPDFAFWQGTHARAVGLLTGIASAAFGTGFAIELPVLVTAAGVVVGAVAVRASVNRGLKAAPERID
jgi:hypothetical protein